MQAWRDFLFLHYGINPPDLPDHCNGCVSELSICHALNCKKDGISIACHNELRDGVANLLSKDFTPTHVRDDDKIFTGRAVRVGKSKSKVKRALPKEKGETKGYIIIRDLWMQGTESINNMCVVNTNAVSHQPKTPEKSLETAEREKNKKYLHPCLNERRKFTPFVS